MSDRQALLDAVFAHPDEDTPRLVLADWMDEHAEGLPSADRPPVQAQAELLRLHVAFAQALEDTPEHARLQTRINALEEAHRTALLAGVPTFAAGWVRPTRGLPVRLEITGRQLLKNGKRLRRELRYESLKLRNVGGVLEDIVNAGLLAGVRELDIAFSSVSDGELTHLFRSPDVAALRDLNLNHIRFGDGPAEVLAASQHLAGLNRLSVWWCNPNVGRALAGPNCVLGNLTRLHIGNSGIDTATVAGIVGRPTAKRLIDLELSYNVLGPELAEVLARAPRLSGLRRV
ncbi:MAG: TIGR02996 domain-containing protein, partial [Gemmataceae bacterium]|nr:TIGR02996 domain-containing protein [Gemmataceae bacterium]